MTLAIWSASERILATNVVSADKRDNVLFLISVAEFQHQ
jgi:hypothetical protein